MMLAVCEPEPVEGEFILAYRLRQAQPDSFLFFIHCTIIIA
jgi:hypothetical protein